MYLPAYTFFLALLISTALLPLLFRLASSFGLIDYPDFRKIHQKPIPRVGGIAIVIGIIVPILLWVPMRSDIQGYLYAVTFLAVLMVQDDRKNLDFRIKFIGQVAAALIVILYGDVVITHFPYVPDDKLPLWLAIPFTICVLVGVTNAINLSDGVDGLAGGTTILTAGSFGLLAYKAGDTVAFMLALAVIGGTVGFLRYNTYPARVFMGDVGSQCLGFSVGVLAIIVTQSSNQALSPVLPLLILGLPILDTLWVMGRRIAEGRSPFSPDRKHIHHRLLDLGLTYYEVVVVIYSAQIILIILAYLLAYSMDSLLLGIYGMFCIFAIMGLSVAERMNISFNNVHPNQKRLLVSVIDYAKYTKITSRLPFGLIYYLMPLLFITGAVVVEEVPFEYGVAALILLGLFVIAIPIGHVPYFPLVRFIIYLTAASEVYLLAVSNELNGVCGSCLQLVYAALAAIVAVWIRFSSGHFKFNPLDYLFILILVVVPNLILFQGSMIGQMVIEIMITFYACEIVISENKQKWNWLHLGVIAALAIVGLRGLAM
jgi:UDP-GlcNAc:undecaprenyl-phosphate GlcNAc-1-phosphate transferase